MTIGLNRAKMITTTTGTGTVTLGSAVTGYATFAEAGAANATQYSYVIEDGNDFEIGVGTYTVSGTTFSRDTVTLSKIGGTAGTSKINLSGSAQIAITARSSDLVGPDNFASQAEAEAGANATKYMNPLRTNQAISALVPPSITTLASGAISSGTQVNYSGSLAAYKKVEFLLVGLSVVSGGTKAVFRFSQDAGSTFCNVEGGWAQTITSTVSGDATAGASSSPEIGTLNAASATANATSILLEIFNPGSAYDKFIRVTLMSPALNIFGVYAAMVSSTTDIDYLRFEFVGAPTLDDGDYIILGYA